MKSTVRAGVPSEGLEPAYSSSFEEESSSDGLQSSESSLKQAETCLDAGKLSPISENQWPLSTIQEVSSVTSTMKSKIMSQNSTESALSNERSQVSALASIEDIADDDTIAPSMNESG